jgi:hypothetical protein
MLSKILLASSIFAQDDAPPPAEAPVFGPYTEETAEQYDHEAMSMVWISFKTETYSKHYYNGEEKKADMKETDATSISSVYGTRMKQLAEEIEKSLSKKYHIVFFDTKEYKDHAIEGLNCKDVETDTCISVLLPMGGDEKEEEEEVVYTRKLGADLDVGNETQMKFILDFVKDVENKSPSIAEYKFTPSFEDEEEGDDAPPEDDGFGSDDEAPEAPEM